MKRETGIFLGGFASGVATGLVLAAVIAVALAGLQVRAYRARAAARDGQLAKTLEGAKAQDFELKDVNPASPTHGRRVRASDLWGERGVLMNFMASWCGPCRIELPDLQAIQDSGKARVVCVAASESGDSADLVALLREARVTLPVLYAAGDAAALLDQRYTHEVLPSTYVIDRTGAIRALFQGVRPRRVLEEAVGKSL